VKVIKAQMIPDLQGESYQGTNDSYLTLTPDYLAISLSLFISL
jgi:hypothetical protein